MTWIAPLLCGQTHCSQHGTAVPWAMEKVLEKNNIETSKRFGQLYCLKTTPKPTNQPTKTTQSKVSRSFLEEWKGAGAATGAGLVVWWCSLSLSQSCLLAWLLSSVIVNWMLRDGSGHLAPCLLRATPSSLGRLGGELATWYCGGHRLRAHPALLTHSGVRNSSSSFSLLLCSPLPSQLVCWQPNTQLMTPSSLSFPLSATMDKHWILP